MNFPIYRKYSSSPTVFKIVSLNRFEEISFIGSKGFFLEIQADQYPEQLRIRDMIDCRDGTWIEISEAEYLKQKNSI